MPRVGIRQALDDPPQHGAPDLFLLDREDPLPKDDCQVGKVGPREPQTLLSQAVDVFRASACDGDGFPCDEVLVQDSAQPHANGRSGDLKIPGHFQKVQGTDGPQQFQQVRVCRLD